MRQFMILFALLWAAPAFSSTDAGNSSNSMGAESISPTPQPESVEAPKKHARWSAGLGLGNQTQTDVNPGMTSDHSFGEVYASFEYAPWNVLWEMQRSQSGSSIGNYAIHTTSYETMLWGRYEVWPKMQLRPYAGLGLGWDFHQVNTDFGTAHDSRSGSSGTILGAAAGFTTIFYKHWNLEAELRLSKVELESDPSFGFVFRTGFTF